MRRYLATLLLCSAPLGCSGDLDVDESSASRAAQTAEATLLDGGPAAVDASGPEDAAREDAGARAPGAAASDPCQGVSPDAADKAALHAAAAGLLTQQTPCGFSSCHTGSSRARAGLRLLGATDLRTLLVDKASCIAPSLPLVDGSGGAAALERSWLWQKLAAPTDASGVLQSRPAWGAPVSCGQDPSEPHGLQMPLATGPLEAADLAVVRSWICAGAPGPG
ncbi:MAG: hypothetical protein ABW252_22885 [Polyangiales bacterium]